MPYKISIIIPVYNCDDYLEKAFQSIKNQSIGFGNLEVIMVDDCSTDNSARLIENFADNYENCTALHLSENSGAAGKPRNEGMKQANGEYLMFLDPDDVYTPDACEILYEKISENGVDVVCGTYTLIDEISGNRRKVHAFLNNNKNDEVKLKSIGDDPNFLDNPASIWAKIFRRTFIEENEIIFPPGIPSQDHVFVSHVLLKADGIIFLDQVIAQYNNIRKSSISHKTNISTLNSRVKAYCIIYQIFKKNGKGEYFTRYILENKLKYWINTFLKTDASKSEKLKALELARPMFKLYGDFDAVYPPYLDPIYRYISTGALESALLLLGQVVYLKELENKDKKSQKKLKDIISNIKSKEESIREMKVKLSTAITDYNILKANVDNLQAQCYEYQFYSNSNRKFMQRLTSKFPSLYMLFKIRETGRKNTILYIKGYRSIKKNNLFDVGHYLLHNEDVRISGEDPLLHYIYKGHAEGRSIKYQFKTENFQDKQVNPLVQYSLQEF